VEIKEPVTGLIKCHLFYGDKKQNFIIVQTEKKLFNPNLNNH
jgi:hypothetical protein